ncbi:MAG TPA: alpha-amylase family glycosyl hydrolase, partial [Candidatus Acidoferrales bacterium]|nr:alpha-amylase family glycosyl hydrolase [Candidatus Acidoferrales bacterium]
RNERYRLRIGRAVMRFTDGSYTFNTEENYRLARDLRRFCIERRSGRDEIMLVGECSGTLEEVARYSRYGDALTHGFLFDFLMFRFDADWFRQRIDAYERSFPYPAEPAYVFENHDRTRLLDRVGGDLLKGRLLATLLCTLRGQPTIYQGQELGMTNTYIPLREGRDPMAAVFSWMPESVNRRLPERVNRDEVRTPMQWDTSANAGFCPVAAKPWLPLNQNSGARNVAVESNDSASMLSLYRELLALRRKSAALRRGRLDFVAGAPRDVLAFTRTAGAESLAVVCNFARENRTVALRNPVLALASVDGVDVRDHAVVLPPFAAAIVSLDNNPGARLP